MGLSFITSDKSEGTVCYILCDSRAPGSDRNERLAADIKRHGSSKVHVLDINTREGEETRDFYDILPEQLPAILVVRDNDMLAYSWFSPNLPMADEIAYNLNQIG